MTDVYFLKNYTHVEFNRTISWVRRDKVFYLDIRQIQSPRIRSYTADDFGGVSGVVKLRKRL